jgi:hypothetical protein
MVSATLCQSTLFLLTSCMLGAHVLQGVAPDTLFWDTSGPYDDLWLIPRRTMTLSSLAAMT